MSIKCVNAVVLVKLNILNVKIVAKAILLQKMDIGEIILYVQLIAAML